MQVKEILRRKSVTIITITATESLLSASQLLTKHNIGALVVINPANEPVGILSERDIVREIAKSAKSALDLTVESAMTHDIILAYPDDSLAEISNTMTRKRIRHLPVLEGQDIVGMISIGDVVKAQLDHAEHEAHTLRQYITGGYS